MDDELNKTMGHTKWITLLDMNRFQTLNAKGNNVLGRELLGDTQCLAAAGTISGRMDLSTFMRRRAGADTRRILEKFTLLLINCALGDPNRRKFRNSKVPKKINITKRWFTIRFVIFPDVVKKIKI